MHDVHVWHPGHGWPCGVDRPDGEDPIPKSLNWDHWLGPAAVRPYKTGIYHPFQWRGWYDFGNGSIGDFCCHSLNLPVRALKLDYATHIDPSGTGLGMESYATTCRVRFDFPQRGKLTPVSITWHSGQYPDKHLEAPSDEVIKDIVGFGQRHSGVLFRGDEGQIYTSLWNSGCQIKLKNDPKFEGVQSHAGTSAIPQTLSRAKSHMQEWVDACRGGPSTYSSFDIGGHITEIGLSGNLALRLQRPIDWDGQNMKIKGTNEADAFIRPIYRTKWITG